MTYASRPLLLAIVLCAAFLPAQAQDAVATPPSGRPAQAQAAPAQAQSGEAGLTEAGPVEDVIADDAVAQADPAAQIEMQSSPVATPAANRIGDGAAQAPGLAPATASDPQTQAELDGEALYGTPPPDVYDPVFDPTLPAPAEMPVSYDPWEKLNRRTHAFNNVVDRTIALPLAKAYVKVTPRPVRLGVSNFFNNLGQPVSALNALLQGKPKQAGQSFGRFVVNTTIGVAGFFDPATRFKIPDKSEDLGQTLGVWGWKRSRYVELPLFGPRTVRDVFGLVGDGQLSPIRQIEDDKIRVFTQGLQLVDVRTQLMAIDSLREGAADEYALFRDSWLQRRNYQIQGDRKNQDDDASLPDYLRDEENNPTVPADAMPIIPGSAP